MPRLRLSLALFSLLAACSGKTIIAGSPDAEVDTDVDGDVIPDVGADTAHHLDETGTGDPDVSIPDVGTHKITSGKVDLLFVVDNSISMADKQGELARQIPQLIASLTADPHVADIHVGVISSSLGSHGTSACDPSITNPSNDDRGHLLPRDAVSGTGYDTTGEKACPTGIATASALTWTFSPGSAKYTGAAGTNPLEVASSCVVAAVQQNGCGYEETWESLYHFLVDPKPYASAKVKCTFTASGDACGSSKIEVSGTDDALLAQRAAFLRPDSFLAVVILSDENDASLKPAGLNWLPWGYGKGQMQRGWSGCASVPDDFEPESPAEFNTLHTMYNCKSCFEDISDPNCHTPWAVDPKNNDIDDRNLRAFQQTKRFGYNFLYSRQRYVNAFTSPMVIASDGTVGPNPIFAGGERGLDGVLVATIVGVPPNLVSNADGSVKLLGAPEWNKIIGPVGVRDPHMIESIAPRAGIAKFAGDRSVDPMNGGDRDINGDDLQYACIGKRAVTAKSDDCLAADSDKTNPLCDATSQPYYKAFPGLRHLRVVHDLGSSGVAGSICSPFGPVLESVSAKIRAKLAGG